MGGDRWEGLARQGLGERGLHSNELSGRVAGPVVQAGSVAGGVHIHAPVAPEARVVPRQLPPGLALFTGRADDLATLDRLWEQAVGQGVGLVVVISGTAGVGKTSLAVTWLRARVAGFGDGDLYADLGGYSAALPASPSEVAGGFLRALGVAPELVPVRPAERAALLRTVTFERRIGVLLDNALSAAQVRSLALASPGCATLVTTRGALTGLAMDGARFYTLEPWRSDTGVLLMERILGEARVRAERGAAGEIARLCGGLPLAVGIATAKLVSRPRWSLSRLAQELAVDGRRLEVLAADADRAVVPALDGSYRALPEAGRRVYRMLGVCPVAWFDLGVVAAVLDTQLDDAEQQVDVLVDASLLEDLGGRYRFHDLVRLHAANSAREHGDEVERAAVLGRLVDYFLRAATDVEERVTPSHRILERDYRYPASARIEFGGEQQALAWMEFQRPNLLSVVRWCAHAGDHRSVWQLVDALWPLFLRGRYLEERLEAQQLALAAARADGHARAVGTMLTSLAGTMSSAERLKESVRYGEQALAWYERIGDLRGLSQAANGLAKTCLAMGDVQRAEQLFARALEVRVAIGYRRGAYLSHQGLGRVAVTRGDLDGAARHLRRSYRGLSALRDRYDAAWSLALWAKSNAARGQVGRALRQLDLAVRLMDATGSRFGRGGVREILGELYEAEGQRAAAREQFAAALDCLGASDPGAAARIRTRLEQIEAALGEPPSQDAS
jgi:tetratricopeptide (TPR) repeat protein